MIRVLLTILLSLTAMCAMASDGVVKGKILDKTTNEALGFVNVRVTRRNSTELVKGDVTDIDGNFSITGLPVGDYTLSVSRPNTKRCHTPVFIWRKIPRH